MSSNAEVRASIKQMRSRLKPDFQKKASQQILQKLMTLPQFNKASQVASYLAYAGEVPTTSIIDHIWQQGKTCFLPVLQTTPNKHLTFHAYGKDTPLSPNQYHIDEPATSFQITLTDLDVVIVPLVAFDQNCHRLGMGAGFYDRTFALRKRQDSPLLIGIAYEMQKIATITPNDWDIAMDFIVTEEQIYTKPI